MTFDYPLRRERLKEVMADKGVDAVILSVGPDLPYFTGYEAMPSERLTALVLTPSDAVLYVPALEAPGVQVSELEVRPWTETTDPVALAAQSLDEGLRIAVGNHMWSVFLTRFMEEVGGCTWMPAADVTSVLRVLKDDQEIDLLRRAAHGIDRVMGRIPAEVRFSGRTEASVARDFAEMTVEEGHEESTFTIVASGSNGASPHHHPGARLVEEGDLVVCDFGGRLGGYFSDSTRTFVVGEPSAEQVEIHDLVLRANEAGRRTARAGVRCSDVDEETRRVIDVAGYGEYFIHRTGHGIGLEVHEHPYIVAGNEEPLQWGMTFSVEPGIYLPGRFGVRIEDIVVCTRDGLESLNTASRALAQVS